MITIRHEYVYDALPDAGEDIYDMINQLPDMRPIDMIGITVDFMEDGMRRWTVIGQWKGGLSVGAYFATGAGHAFDQFEEEFKFTPIYAHAGPPGEEMD